MKKRKKIILLSCMIALLAVTAIFNFVLSTNTSVDNTSSTVNASSFFAQYRTERMSTRNEELLQLDSILASSNNQTAEYTSALNMKMELTDIVEKEFLTESLLKAYGFEDVVVLMGRETDSVNVMVKCADFSNDDAIKVYTVISEELLVGPENIKIIPIS